MMQKKILLIRNDHIGDIVLSIGILKELKKKFPELKIDFIASKRGVSLIEKNKDIRKKIILSYKLKSIKDFFNYFKKIFEIRKEKYDVGIDLRGAFFNILLLRFGNIKYKMGFCKENLFCRQGLDFSMKRDLKKHETENILNLINKGLNLNLKSDFPNIVTTKEDKKKAKEIIKKNKLKKFICVIPDTENSKKQWGLKNFDLLIKKINKKFPSYKVVLFGVDQAELGWLAKKNKKILNLGKVNLRVLYELFKRSSLIISLDVGPMHIAWASKKKLIAIIIEYNSRSIKNINPLGKNSYYFSGKKEEISVEQVFKKICEVLK